MIKCENICKNYYIEGKIVEALKNVSFEIKKGEFVAITGESGSGKSTLMNILGCLDSADSGKYFIDGKEVFRLSSRKTGKLRSEEIGFIFQSFNLIPTLNSYENVRLPLVYRGISTREQKSICDKALKSVGMIERKYHLPSQLSGGQQQRIAIARALASNPKIIFADEPTGNLDTGNTYEVMRLLRNFCTENKAVVIVTHDPKIADSADRVIRMNNGQIDN